MDLFCITYFSLNALRCLLQVILQTEDVIRVYEVRLSEEETVPLDLDKVEAYRACLKVRGQYPRTQQGKTFSWQHWSIKLGETLLKPQEMEMLILLYFTA